MTIIQMSDLNDDRFGRFGNQLFKYFFLINHIIKKITSNN